MEFLKSSVMGNVIGIISLAVGIISLVITIITMKAAKRIEKNIKIAKVEALNKSKFNEFRRNAINKLQQKRKAVLRNHLLTNNTCDDTLSIFNDLNGFSSQLLKEDAQKVYLNINELKDIARELKGTKKKDSFNIQYDRILSEIIHILKKGDYDL